jgi:hypothetical protein
MKSAGYWADYGGYLDVTLPYADQSVDHRWDIVERIKVGHYLRDGIILATHSIAARCILGCKSQAGLGSADFTDGEWQWPEGYAHYVEAHAVKPPPEFLDHIRNNRFHIPRKEG